MKKKTTIIKGSKLTTDGEEWSAWDKVQEETTEEEREQMSLQDFLIAINEAEKAEAAEPKAEQKSDKDNPFPSV